MPISFASFLFRHKKEKKFSHKKALLPANAQEKGL